MAMAYTAGLLWAQYKIYWHTLKIDLGVAREMRAKLTDLEKIYIPGQLFKNAGAETCLETVQNPSIVFLPSTQTRLL